MWSVQWVPCSANMLGNKKIPGLKRASLAWVKTTVFNVCSPGQQPPPPPQPSAFSGSTWHPLSHRSPTQECVLTKPSGTTEAPKENQGSRSKTHKSQQKGEQAPDALCLWTHSTCKLRVQAPCHHHTATTLNTIRNQQMPFCCETSVLYSD